jgi:hypothetical protein
VISGGEDAAGAEQEFMVRQPPNAIGTPARLGRTISRVLVPWLACLIGLGHGLAPAASPELILSDLGSPVAVVVHSDGRRVFIADSQAGQVIVWDGEKRQPLITGLGKGSRPGGEPGLSPGGLAMVQRTMLAVSHVGGENEARISIYELPDGPAEQALSAQQSVVSISTAVAAEPGAARPPRVARLAVNSRAIYATAPTDKEGPPLLVLLRSAPAAATAKQDEPAAALPIELDGEIKALGRAGLARAMGLTLSPRGELVVSSVGTLGAEADARVVFYHAGTGQQLLDLATDRFDLMAIAYSPQGRLYAVDMAWNQPDQGGLYRLDAAVGRGGGVAVQATRLVGLQRPTCMAFARDGSLYITQLGDETDPHPGHLLRIAPGL